MNSLYSGPNGSADEEEGDGSMGPDDLDASAISKEGMYKSASTLNQL